MKTEIIGAYLFLYFVINTTLHQPHGIVEISNVDPKNPQIILNEETNSMVPISIARIGGCKYEAEVRYKCLERTARDGLDFKCHYKTLKWEDGECEEKVVFITIYNDKEYEQDEEFLFQLYSSPENIALGFDRVLIIIKENDINYGEIRIYPTSISIVEGMSVELEVKRMFGKTDNARVCYQVISGTAKINFDVTFTDGCIEWQHNDNNTHLITVDTIRDNLWEANEIFYVKLFNVNGAKLNDQYSQANITILQHNLNVPLISSTCEPCLESKKEVQINPTTLEQCFIQFEVSLPTMCTVNDAHIIAEHITEHTTQLKWILFEIHGIIMDETTVSCENIPNSYNIISNNIDKIELNCNSIINHTIIIDNNINYICNLTVECTNFNVSRNHPKYIDVNTTLSKKKQRLFCEDIIPNTNNISCECDFPDNIYNSDEWLISNLSFGNKYVSNSIKFDIFEMTQQPLWNNYSLATFIFIIKQYDKDKNRIDDVDLTTNWIFYLVTDAFPCQPTNWSSWTECDAKPVGIGHMYRNRIAVHGINGQELQCKELKQHKKCVVNQDKSIFFSRRKIRVQEGDDSATIMVRLNHELTSNKIINKSELMVDKLHALRGYDVIIYFEIPKLYQKEIVIDPIRIGWYKDNWDAIHEIKITALDDSNIDALEQTITVTPKIDSIDKDYDELVVNTLTIIVEDNEKCRYCGEGNISKFNPVPKPLFWDFKSIIILIAFLLMVVFIFWRFYHWFKLKYGVNNEYEKLEQDGLLNETISKSEITESITEQISSKISTVTTDQSESDDDDDDT